MDKNIGGRISRFPEKLEATLKFLRKHNKYEFAKVVTALIADNISMNQQLTRILNEQRSSEEGRNSTEPRSNELGAGTTRNIAGHSNPQDSATPIHVGEGEEQRG